MNARLLLRAPILPAAFAGLLVLAPAAAPAHADGAIDRFVGSFVGSGTATVAGEQGDGAVGEETRDLDVTIRPYKEEGFTIAWITVVRGESGARTDDDVRRREIEESFVPVEGREDVFVLATEGGLFQKPEQPDPLQGDPLRWAAIDGDAMTVYSIAIGPSGSAEMQVYRRTLTGKGMDISFLRLQDEIVRVRMTGQLVRTK